MALKHICKMMETLLLIFALGNGAFSANEICIGTIFCIPSNYDKLQRPGRDIVKVNLQIDIIEVVEFDDKEFTSTIMMYFKTSWIEPRLMTNTSTKHTIDLSILDDLWKPDIYIYNLKRIRSHMIFSDMAGKSLYHVKLNYVCKGQLHIYRFHSPLKDFG